MRTRSLILSAAVALGGCAHGGKDDKPTVKTYEPTLLSQAFDANPSPPRRVVLYALYQGAEEAVLDLPDDFGKGYIRLILADPSQPGFRTSDVVAPQKVKRMPLRKGERVKIRGWMVFRTTEEDMALRDDESKGWILKVERLSRLKPRPAGAPPPPAMPAPQVAEGPAGVYRHGDDENTYVALAADGSFRIRDRGQEISGLYSLDGETIRFALPNGVKAKGSLSGDVLVDPSGKEWVREDKTSTR